MLAKMLSYINDKVESVLSEIASNKGFVHVKTLSPKLVSNIYKSLKFVIPKDVNEVMIVLPLRVYKETDIENLKFDLNSIFHEVEIYESSISENIIIFYK